MTRLIGRGLMIVMVAFLMVLPGNALAAPTAVDLTQQPAIAVRISLGTPTNELKFVPNTLTFQAGNRYKLVLDNPSPQKHYFTAKDFADASWTQKIEAGGVEIKGAIHEVELKPAAHAEWVLVPLKPGAYDLRCSIPGHTEAGMTGKLLISAK